MSDVALFEAKDRLSGLLDRVAAGETFNITRCGKVVARLPAPEAVDATQRLALVHAASALRLQVDREPVGMVDAQPLSHQRHAPRERPC